MLTKKHIINPRTGRLITVGGTTYNKLLPTLKPRKRAILRLTGVARSGYYADKRPREIRFINGGSAMDIRPNEIRLSSVISTAGGVSKKLKPSAKLSNKLHKIWLEARQKRIEIAGEINPQGIIVGVQDGDEHSVQYIGKSLHLQFHTHPVGCIKGETLLVDKMTPPSGADYIFPSINEYVVTKTGIWLRCQIKNPPTNLEDAIDVYYQVLLYLFTSGSWFGKNLNERQLANVYISYANKIQPKKLIKGVSDSFASFVNDQLTRTYHSPHLSYELFKRKIPQIEGKKYYRVTYWNWSDLRKK